MTTLLEKLREAADEAPGGTTDIASIRRRLRDYAAVGQALFSQRIAIYTLAIALAGAYYSVPVALFFYACVWLAEAYDYRVFRNIRRTKSWNDQKIRASMRGIYIGTFISSVVVSGFSVTLSILQGVDDGHFLPLFLLFSASVFAAINNRHFLPVLALRVSIYVAAILFIPVRDLWITRAPLSSEVWLHLFTVVFVLGFIVECARSFLIGYDQYLTGRRELEEEHERTKAAYEAKSRFLSTVSHELRTPLTSIKGSLELINSGMLGPIPDKMTKPVDVAMRNSRRLAELVNDLLLLQKSEQGEYDFDLEISSMSELVSDSCEHFRPFAEKAGVSMEWSAPEDDLWARIDRKRMDQVITNILSNAAKFSDADTKGEVFVDLKRHGRFVRVSITDNGIGIPEDAHERVFEAFQQIDSSRKRKFEGTGLGLSISKRIVEAHQGAISFTSKLGVGTTFHVDIPEDDEPISIKAAE